MPPPPNHHHHHLQADEILNYHFTTKTVVANEADVNFLFFFKATSVQTGHP